MNEIGLLIVTDIRKGLEILNDHSQVSIERMSLVMRSVEVARMNFYPAITRVFKWFKQKVLS